MLVFTKAGVCTVLYCTVCVLKHAFRSNEVCDYMCRNPVMDNHDNHHLDTPLDGLKKKKKKKKDERSELWQNIQSFVCLVSQ